MHHSRHARPLPSTLACTTAALALAMCGIAMGAAPAPDDDLHLDLSLGLWGTSVSGTTGIGRLETDVDVSFDDIIRHTNFAAMGGAEMSKGNWILYLNGMYCQLNGSATGVRGQDADLRADMGIGDLAVGYTLVRTEVGTMPLTLTPAIGARYTYLSESIDVGSLPSIDENRQWIDPYIGGRVVLGLTDNLAWRTEGSVGGTNFVSDTTWSAATYLDWEFAKSFILNVGYRALSWDYDQNDLKWEITFHGPWIGLTWRAF
jgi:hypothetical protein